MLGGTGIATEANNHAVCDSTLGQLAQFDQNIRDSCSTDNALFYLGIVVLVAGVSNAGSRKHPVVQATEAGLRSSGALSGSTESGLVSVARSPWLCPVVGRRWLDRAGIRAGRATPDIATPDIASADPATADLASDIATPDIATPTDGGLARSDPREPAGDLINRRS